MSSMLVIVPSRGRPHRFGEFLDAWEATTDDADLLVALDDDDPTIADYPPIPGMVRDGPRLGLMPTLDKYAMEMADRYDIIGHLGDDHICRTQGWDGRVREALETPGLAFGDDLMWSKVEMIPTHVFMSSSIIRALGHMTLPGVRHHGDAYWRDLGNGAGCLRFLPDLIFEHKHMGNGKARNDATYDAGGGSFELLHREQAEVWAPYYEAGGLERDVAKVKAL